MVISYKEMIKNQKLTHFYPNKVENSDREKELENKKTKLRIEEC